MEVQSFAEIPMTEPWPDGLCSARKAGAFQESNAVQGSADAIPQPPVRTMNVEAERLHLRRCVAVIYGSAAEFEARLGEPYFCVELGRVRCCLLEPSWTLGMLSGLTMFDLAPDALKVENMFDFLVELTGSRSLQPCAQPLLTMAFAVLFPPLLKNGFIVFDR